MERRVLLAITLSFLVLFLFQRFVMPPPPARPANQSAAATQAAQAPGPASHAPSPQVAASAPTNASPPAPLVTVGDVDSREIVVETTKVRAVFSNRGATILHW